MKKLKFARLALALLLLAPEVVLAQAPVLVGSIATGSQPSSVAVRGTTVYVINAGSNTLQVFDVSNPASPVLLGSAATDSQPTSLVVTDTIAYVADFSAASVEVFNVRNPANPTLIHTIATEFKPTCVAVKGNAAYVVSEYSNSLQTFDVTDPSQVYPMGFVPTGDMPRSVTVSGSTAYVVSFGSNMLHTYDVHNPANPVLLDSTATGLWPWSVEVNDTVAYIVNNGGQTLQLFDVRSPGNPVLLDSIATESGPLDVAVVDNKAYVINSGTGTLQVFDVQHPANPGLLYTVATGVSPVSVAVSGSTTYVVGGNLLRIFQPAALPPAITCTPSAGSPGAVALVTGTGFTPSTVVRFNGVAATGTVYNSATQVTATVPAGAATGPVTATTGATVLAGNSFTVSSAPAPTIRLFSPTAAPVGSVVTLTGANFSGVTGVRFGNTPAPGFVLQSATSLTVPVPTGAENTRIYVLTAAGMAQTPGRFTLMLPPTISSFGPGSGTPGAVVEINGTHLATVTDVTFGGGTAASFTVLSARRLTAIVPAGATTGPLTLTTVAGTATSTSAFTVTVPAPPAISGFAPGAGAVGMTVVISGTNFSGATQVRFNTTAAPGFVVNSATQITATVPAGASLGSISVLTAGGMAQSAAPFKVVPVPTISSFWPAAGSPGAVVVLSGTGLLGATSVTVGGVTAASFGVNSATQLTAIIPVGAASGLIGVTTPGGTATSTAVFNVTAAVAPQLTSFSPASGPAATSVTITGTNLTGTTAVRFNNTPAASFTLNSATSLTATVPAGATTGKLYVLTAGGLAQSAASFTVVQPPTLTALLPDNGTRGSVVILQGTNLTGATGVTFGGAAATTFTVNSAKQLTAVVPNAAVTGPVTVTTVAGTATSPAPFTITLPPPPTISGLSPASGTTGTSVTLTGAYFVNVRKVFFGLKPAESFVVTSATSLTAQVPGNAPTGPVYVVADGGLATSATPFTVVVPPSISGFTPAHGPVGTVVTIKGVGLLGATDVRFGNTSATGFVLNSATSLTATVPSGVASGQVRVTTSLGTGISAGTFVVTAARTDTAGAAWLARQTFRPAVSAFPNPAHGLVTVQLRHWPAHEPLPATADLFDALGRRMRMAALRPEAVPTTEIALTGLPPGLYFVRAGGVTERLLVE